MANILLLDNIDSFTYNLVDQLRIKKNIVLVYRNTVNAKIILDHIRKIKNPILMLSPGPGIPKKAGCMLHLIEALKGKIPIIGICLGHQAIVEAYGGLVGYSKEVFHGKASLIEHDGLEMFKGLPNPLSVARYHSLICQKIPPHFVINSHFKKMIMSIRNNKDKVCGFQFHPESILTPYGDQLIEKVLNWVL